ncbi:LytTR family DNA-binding domain-containing protein [Cytophagales bacterium LB-30]|uniref:LytTR family DNA-binding domain-containing protein n=1 Tax=Shiella aurantiaca TaxID=3058365 RepID=A0ABT8F7N2_9BACT|nr:LytTR family DNA-binding domain-containing protein [Shiella aurantiaca]MDN4166498.1 LytTR family DNA-binding domain-containing protein [Shiella aurantiaca]
MKINCLIVDDEKVSRKVVARYVELTNYLHLTKECETAEEALQILKEEDIDIIFLDIQMPGMSGMELLQTFDNAYEVILITGVDSYAVQAFENKATDYLVKPFDYNRFLKAVTRAKENIENFRSKSEKFTDLFFKSDSRMVRAEFSNIFYIEAMADYVVIVTENAKYIVHSTMKGIENRLPSSMFARVHRSYIVNMKKIEYMEDMAVHMRGKAIPIGASYKENYMERLNFL